MNARRCRACGSLTADGYDRCTKCGQILSVPPEGPIIDVTAETPEGETVGSEIIDSGSAYDEETGQEVFYGGRKETFTESSGCGCCGPGCFLFLFLFFAILLRACG
jgi:hypothetical protein